MTPSRVRRGRARNHTDCNCCAKRKCDQSFFHHITPLLRFDPTSGINAVPNTSPQQSECSGSVRTAHWRSSTIGSSSSNSTIDKNDLEVDCRHGGTRPASAGVTRRRFTEGQAEQHAHQQTRHQRK
jgi:hypothetical protein